MSEKNLPSSWAEAKIQDLSDRKGGGTPSRKVPAYFKGDIPWITVADIPRNQTGVFTISNSREAITKAAIDESACQLIPAGSIILSTRVSVGKVGINSVPLCTNQDFSSFINCKVNSKYFANFLFYKQDYFLGQAKGATIKGISLPVVTELKMPVPPLKEQIRIVGKLESTHGKINDVGSVVARAEELIGKYREALMQKAFRGKLLSQNPGDETANELLKRIRVKLKTGLDGNKKKRVDLPLIKLDEIPFEIPRTWQWARLGDVCTKITDGFHNTPKKVAKGFPYISAVHVKDERIDWANHDQVGEEDHKELFQKAAPQRGDILVVNIGAGCGSAAIVDVDYPFSFKNVAILKFQNDLILNEYLLCWLLATKQKIYADVTSGGCQPFLSLKMLNNLILPLPPTNEQRRIVSALRGRLAGVQKVRSTIQALENKVEELQSSILNQAFSGRLVPQFTHEGTGQQLIPQIGKLEEVTATSKKSPAPKTIKTSKRNPN